MEGINGFEFCKKVFEDLKKYSILWNKFKTDKGHKKSPTASGSFVEEIIRKHLSSICDKYVSDKEVKLISGIIHDNGKMKPQIDIIVCKPSSEEDAVLDLNGLIDIKSARCAIEIKSLANKGIEGIKSDITQIKNLGVKGKLPTGILWVDFRGKEEKRSKAIDYCEKEGITAGIVGWYQSRKCQRESKSQDEQDTYYFYPTGECWKLNVENSVDNFLNWFVQNVIHKNVKH